MGTPIPQRHPGHNARLEQARERQQRLEAARIEWKDGVTVPFLGEPVIVVIDPRHADAGAMLRCAEGALPGVPSNTLHVGLPHTASPAQMRDAVQAWLMRQARRVFAERLDHYAPQLGVRWRKLDADGAERFEMAGVHYACTSVEAVLYDMQDVAVVGAGNSAGQAAM